MTRPLARSHRLIGRIAEAGRIAAVSACALALIAAGQALPF